MNVTTLKRQLSWIVEIVILGASWVALRSQSPNVEVGSSYASLISIIVILLAILASMGVYLNASHSGLFD
jgi:hypothetical protein